MPLRFLIYFPIFTALLFAQYTVVFPGGVVTDANLGIVSYRAASTLVAGINASQPTLQVQPGDGSLFAVNNFVIIESEKMLITSKSTDILTVTRGFAATTAAVHAINTPIVNATLPDYHNRMAAEMKAVQANVLVKGNNLSDVTNAATARTSIGAAPLASPTFTGTVTGTFSGNLTGAVTGNATTATSAGAFTANPGGCATNFALNDINASGGVETCINLPSLYQSLDQDLTALSALAATAGLMARTGAGTFAVRTLTGTASQITVTNADGAAGNPTISIPTSPTFTTPTIASFVNSVHNHTNAAGGAQLTDAALSTTVTVPKGGTGLAAGSSGGVPFFSGTSAMASSATLTANLPVIGGGAGVAPAVGTRSGNTTQFVTTTGTQTSGRCVEIDANGNHIQAAAGCGSGGGGAPTTATYITQTADGALSAEQALSTLATGIVKVANGTGVLSVVTGGATDCVRVNGTSGACTGGTPASPYYLSTAVGNGSTNDTAAFTANMAAASAAGLTLYVPKPSNKYMVDPLVVPGNLRIYLAPGVIIEARAGYAESSTMFGIEDVSNVEVIGYGATLQMPKAEYTTGEHRHCSAIRGGWNIQFKGFTCKDSGGDGVYIGVGSRNSDNVLIQDMTLDNNRRQGLSLISGNNIRIIGNRMINTVGTDPQAGIDIEPNSNTDSITGVVIDNNETSNNTGGGLLLSFFALTNAAIPIDLKISNSRGGNEVTSIAGLCGTTGSSPTGKVVIDNYFSYNTAMAGVMVKAWSKTCPDLVFNDLTIVNANTGGGSPGDSAVWIYRDTGGFDKIGNMTFNHPTIKNPGGHVLTDYFSIYDTGSVPGWSGWSVKDPVLSGAANAYSVLRAAAHPGNLAFVANPIFDATNNNSDFGITITANVTSSTLVGAVAGQRLSFVICQNATGGRTFVPPTNVIGWRTIVTTANTCDTQYFVFDGTNARGIDTGTGSGAPTGATYITQTADGTLSNEQALSALSTGVVRVTTGTGALTSVANGTANQVLGMNNAATTSEYKTITAGANITVTHGVGAITIGGSTASGTALNVVSTATHGSDPTGVANSSTAFANALAAVAVNGTVMIPCGIYRLDSILTVTSRNLKAAYPRCVMLNKNHAQEVIRVDGTDSSVEGVIANANRTGFPGTGQGIVMTGTRIIVKNNEIKESANRNVYMFLCTDCQVLDNWCHDSAAECIWGTGDVYNAKIHNNTVTTPGSHSVAFHSEFLGTAAHGVEVTNNTLEVGNVQGFCVEIGSFNGDYPRNVKVTDNKCTVRSNSYGGYSIANTYNALISQNTYDGQGFTVNYCLEMFGSYHMTAIGNTCLGMSDTIVGLEIDKSMKYSSFIGNTIQGFRNHAQGVGIMISTSQTADAIDGNVLAGNTVTFSPGVTQGIGILLNHNFGDSYTSFNHLLGNFVYGAGTTGSSVGIAVQRGAPGSIVDSNIVSGNVIKNVNTAIQITGGVTNTITRDNLIEPAIPNKYSDTSTTKGLISEASGTSMRIEGLKTAGSGTGAAYVCVDNNGVLFRKSTCP